MKAYFHSIEPYETNVSFNAEMNKVYEVKINGVKFGPFVYVDEMEVPPQANVANDPSSVHVTCKGNRINVILDTIGAYSSVLLIERDDIDEGIAAIVSELSSISGKLDTANSLLTDIKANTTKTE